MDGITLARDAKASPPDRFICLCNGHNEKHVHYISTNRTAFVMFSFRLRVTSNRILISHERSFCAPSLASSFGASGSLAMTFSNCDQRLST